MDKIYTRKVKNIKGQHIEVYKLASSRTELNLIRLMETVEKRVNTLYDQYTRVNISCNLSQDNYTITCKYTLHI